LTETQRQLALDTIQNYLVTNTDLRGFDDTVGWRHAVAHSADVLLQMVLNEKTTAEQIKQISEIVASNINPSQTHFYQFDEPHRLMRPIVYALLQDKVDKEYWQQWLTAVVDPTPLANWGDAFKSEKGLAKRHNTKAFLNALYVTSISSGNEKLAGYKEDIEKSLRQFR
jgi:hypothetical protein